LISCENKYLTTTFIQLLKTKKIKNKYSEKNHEKRKIYLNVAASEAKERKKNRKAY
jgi:hypothetical protein